MAQRYESQPSNPSPSLLAQPLTMPFSHSTAPNRFLKAAMTERLASWSPKDHSARGIPTPGLINVYKRWAEGGSGHILTGNVMMYYDQLEAPGNTVVPRDSPMQGERFDAFKKMGQAAKSKGGIVVAQLSHPGRQCADAVNPNPVSASDVQLEGNLMGMTFGKPHPASKQEISEIIEGFAYAAEYLYKAGYDGVELHAAHGYLLAQFLAQTTNKRIDEYGGSLENRARIIIEIADAIRKRIPTEKFTLGIKLNSVEFQQGGFQPEEAKQLCKMLEAHTFDFVELSGGTYEHLAFEHKRESTKKREAFFLEFAEMIKPALSKTKVYVTGGFKTLGAMVDAMSTVDGCGLARPLCQEPRLPNDMLNGKTSAAIKVQLDEHDFATTNVCAGTQIRQIAKDQEPFDGGKEENIKGFKEDFGKWMEAMGHNDSGEMYGYVDIHSMQGMPYAMGAPTAKA